MLPASILAQESSQTFSLPDARAGEAYRVNLETVLREKYGLRLESGARNAIIQWAVAGGDLPAGVSVRTDGTIIGQPDVARTDNYRFRLRVVDASVKDEELLLDFILAVKPGRLRLSKIEGPRLVPVDLRMPAITGPSLTTADGGPSSRQSDGATTEASTASLVPPENTQTTGGKSTQNTGATTTQTSSVSRAATDTSAQEPFSSMNKRFIVGFEQAGAASSDSQSKPFFDLFQNGITGAAPATCDIFNVFCINDYAMGHCFHGWGLRG